MRTGLFVAAGVLLLGAAMILGRLFSSNFRNAPLQATGVVVVLWLALSGFNLWVGMTRAGYAVAEELPVFALILLVPVALAVLASWRGL